MGELAYPHAKPLARRAVSGTPPSQRAREASMRARHSTRSGYASGCWV